MIINQFTFNGKKSYDDMNLIITETPSRISPARRVTFTKVDGRSGDIINDENCFDNGEIKYKVTAIADENGMSSLAKQVKHWLQGQAGYLVLTDTYDPNYFYLASYTGKIDIEDKLGLLGNAVLSFTTKPFKYSYAGQQSTTISAAATVTNPELWASKPHIKIVGNGDITLLINSASFTFTDVDGYIEIDSETLLAYKATALQNSKISFADFPVLAAGDNIISFVGNVTEIVITPRWCTL